MSVTGEICKAFLLLIPNSFTDLKNAFAKPVEVPHFLFSAICFP